MGFTLYLKISDLCSFVQRTDRVTLLMPWARRPIRSPDTVRPSAQSVTPIEPHFPVLEFYPEELSPDNEMEDYVAVRRKADAREVGLWFFNEHQLSIQSGKSSPLLTVSQAFQDHVVHFSEIYADSQFHRVDPVCLTTNPNSGGKRLDARLDIDDGHLTVVKRTVEDSKLIEWEFRTLTGERPTAVFVKEGLAEECLLAVPDIESVAVARTPFAGGATETLPFRPGCDIRLHLTNAPIADWVLPADQDIPPFERKRAKHFQVFSDRLLTSIQDDQRLIPWFQDFAITSGLIHCPQSQLDE